MFMKRLNPFFMAMFICGTYPVYAESLPKSLPFKVAFQGSHSFALSKQASEINSVSPLVDTVVSNTLLQQASGELPARIPASSAVIVKDKRAATKSSYQSRQRRFYLKLLMFVGAKSEAN